MTSPLQRREHNADVVIADVLNSDDSTRDSRARERQKKLFRMLVDLERFLVNLRQV